MIMNTVIRSVLARSIAASTIVALLLSVSPLELRAQDVPEEGLVQEDLAVAEETNKVDEEAVEENEPEEGIFVFASAAAAADMIMARKK
jgi:hypothetical protein